MTLMTSLLNILLDGYECIQFYMNACRDSGEGMLMCHKDTEVNVQMNRPEFPNSPLWLGSVQE